MCGRYGFVVEDEKEILNRFDIESADFELRSNYNASPTQDIYVVERHSPNSLHKRKWGITIPISMPKMVEGKKIWESKLTFIINAKAGKLATSRVWMHAFKFNRVIVPANYFIEWKGIKGKKMPYLIRLKSKELFGFAGLLVKYHDKEKVEREGIVIITTEPNELMHKIHDREGLILRKENEADWLNPDITEVEQLEKLLQPYKASDMEAYAISPRYNSPSNNDEDIVKPLDGKYQFIHA